MDETISLCEPGKISLIKIIGTRLFNKFKKHKKTQVGLNLIFKFVRNKEQLKETYVSVINKENVDFVSGFNFFNLGTIPQSINSKN